MPDRIIRDELLDSPKWVGLKDNADRLAYIALLLKADAFGNFTADAWRLRRLWADFGITSDAAVAKTLAELSDHDLVRVYETDGSRFLHIPRFRQRLRYTKRRNAPPSPWCDPDENQQPAKHSPGDSQARTGLSPGAHRVRTAEGRKRSEGSEVKEEKDARESPVDNSAEVVAATHALASKLKGENPKTGNGGKWWTSEAGIAAKGAEIGLPARHGEKYEGWKARIFDEIKRRQQA